MIGGFHLPSLFKSDAQTILTGLGPKNQAIKIPDT